MLRALLQSGDAEKDKLRASLGSAILAERPNVKVIAVCFCDSL